MIDLLEAILRGIAFGFGIMISVFVSVKIIDLIEWVWFMRNRRR